ncbi:Alpha-amylase type B isozyme [Durusdinium trenchii]
MSSKLSQQDGILKLLAQPSGTSKVKAKTSQMEDMVLLLAQQAKAAREASKKGDDEQEDLKELIEELREELKKMQTEIFSAANTSDHSCQMAYDNLTEGCPVYANDTLFLPEGRGRPVYTTVLLGEWDISAYQ